MSIIIAMSHPAIPRRARVATGRLGPLALALSLVGTVVTIGAVPGMATAAPSGHVITTVAGGFSEGPARSFSQALTNVAIRGATLYATDYTSSVIRAIDLTTGNERLVAGSGSRFGFYGDGGPATAAGLGMPQGIAVDAQGNLFIAEFGNRRVRKVTPAGIISTVAGGGPEGVRGDGGPATGADIRPYRLAVDDRGNLYFSDGAMVRKVDGQGRISTVAGGGDAFPLRDGEPAVRGTLTPRGLVLDAAGNLYVADNAAVWRIGSDGAATSIPYRVVGSTAPTPWRYPGGLAVRSDGTLLVATETQVFAVDTAGNATVVAGTGVYGRTGDGGPATFAELAYPTDIAMDATGILYIANVAIRQVDVARTITSLTTDQNPTAYWDGKPAAGVGLVEPSSVAVGPQGEIYIGEREGGRLRKVDRAGLLTTVAGGGEATTDPADGVPARSARVTPTALTVSPSGLVYFADSRRQIFLIDAAGVLRLVAGVAEATCSRYADCGTGDGGPATAAHFAEISGLVVAADGTVYAADISTNRVRQIAPSGIITAVAGRLSGGFSGDGGPATGAALSAPRGLALDAGGGLYIADGGNRRVRKVDVNGDIRTVAGSGSYTFGGDGGPATSAGVAASGIALDPQGNLFVTDGLRVRMVDAQGVISTVAGTGLPGFAGDGGPATEAGLTYPTALAVDGDGCLLVADTDNNRIRRIAAVADVRPPPSAGSSRFHPLSPARILDTRFGTGGVTGALGPGATVDLQVAGRGGVPGTGVTSVAMNVTVTEPTATGYLTVYPSGSARPLASNLNVTPGLTVANLVVVKLGPTGRASLFNSNGDSHVVADIAGWFSDDGGGAQDAGRYHPLVPSRVLDSRYGHGGGIRLEPGTSFDLQVAGRGGVPASGAHAVVLNLAAVNTVATGFLTVHPTGTPLPLASNLNVTRGDAVSNRVMATLGAGGKVTIHNGAGATEVVVDVGGWFSDASAPDGARAYTAVAPARILDTREGAAPLRAGAPIDLQVTGRGGVPAFGVRAVALNVTVTQPAAAGHLTMAASGPPLPLASDLNYTVGETRANLVVVQVGTGGKVSLLSPVSTHVVVDVAGWFS